MWTRYASTARMNTSELRSWLAAGPAGKLFWNSNAPNRVLTVSVPNQPCPLVGFVAGVEPLTCVAIDHLLLPDTGIPGYRDTGLPRLRCRFSVARSPGFP